MAKTPYEIVGVAPDASQDDIRKAYRKLAKKLHPDLNPGDAEAEARFKEVGQAYRIVGNAESRGRFDRGEIDATGAEQPQHAFYRAHAGGPDGHGHPYHSTRGFEDFGDLGDVFSELFRREAAQAGAQAGARASGQGGGGRQRFHARGDDLRYRLEVDFMDAARGGQARVTMADGGTLDVIIPVGARDGMTLRPAGRGGPGLGNGPPGDTLIELAVRPHPVFRRDGDHIRLELPITIDEAVLGGRVQVPTIHGPVTVTVPKGSSSGRVLRLRGKGVRAGASAPQLPGLDQGAGRRVRRSGDLGSRYAGGGWLLVARMAGLAGGPVGAAGAGGTDRQSIFRPWSGRLDTHSAAGRAWRLRPAALRPVGCQATDLRTGLPSCPTTAVSGTAASTADAASISPKPEQAYCTSAAISDNRPASSV